MLNNAHIGSFKSEASTGRLGIWSDTSVDNGCWLTYIDANGFPYIRNVQGYYSFPVVSLSANGQRVSSIGCESSTQLKIGGQWGGNYAYRYVTVELNPSDIRLKENIRDCTVSALPVINAIRMREFDWKEEGRHQAIGVVADELERIDRGLVSGGGYDEDGSMSVKSVNTFYLLGYLVKAVQELAVEVERLKGGAA